MGMGWELRIHRRFAAQHHAESHPGNVKPSPQHKTNRDGNSKKVRAPDEDKEAPQRQRNTAHQANPEPELPPSCQQPQPMQTPIHYGAKNPEIDD